MSNGVGKPTEEVLSLLTGPVKILFGPAFEQLAGAWGDRLKHWREMKQVDLALDAAKQLRAKGLSPKQVAPSLLFPILDFGGLAEEGSLREKWVNLLARAASQGDEVLPAYAAILAQLSSAEVAILDRLFEGTGGNLSEFTFDVHHIGEWTDLHWEVVELYAADFSRLGIWRPRTEALTLAQLGRVVDERADLDRPLRRLEAPQNDASVADLDGPMRYVFTSLGVKFLHACQAL